MRNKLVRNVNQNVYMSAELISADRCLWLGNVEFIRGYVRTNYDVF